MLQALEVIGKSFVQKSATSYPSPRVAHACLISKASETPSGAVIAKRILQLQRQQVMNALYAPIIKCMGLDEDEDGLSI